MATKTERVCERLRQMGLDIPQGAQVRRLYPGRASGQPGQWSWTLVDAEGAPINIGSEFPMTMLLQIEQWDTYKPFSDISVISAAPARVKLWKNLERRGYRNIPEIKGIKVGDRVRHQGEQYYQAYRGTATVLEIMENPRRRLVGDRPDIELIILRDKPLLPGMSRVTQWADYHTAAIH